MPVPSWPAKACHHGIRHCEERVARRSNLGPVLGVRGRDCFASLAMTLISFHRDLRRCGFVEAVVAGPLERDRAAFGRHRVEGDERIGGDRRVKVGAENLLAVVAAGELRDDVARDRLAHVVVTVAGLHDVRDQRLDLDGLPALGLGRHIDEGAGHVRSSRQAASVTMTSAEADQNERSLSSAIATMVWVSARRKRVVIRPRPARGPRRALMMLGCGFFSLKTWIALTWSCC